MKRKKKPVWRRRCKESLLRWLNIVMSRVYWFICIFICIWIMIIMVLTLSTQKIFIFSPFLEFFQIKILSGNHTWSPKFRDWNRLDFDNIFSKQGFGVVNSENQETQKKSLGNQILNIYQMSDKLFLYSGFLCGKKTSNWDFEIIILEINFFVIFSWKIYKISWEKNFVQFFLRELKSTNTHPYD